MRVLSLVVAGFLVSASLVAKGDELFTLTGNNEVITFTLPDRATPSFSDAYNVSFNGVPVLTNGVSQIQTVDFFTSTGNIPGLGLYGPTYQLVLNGPQLFTGTVTNPVFAPGGPYSLVGDYYSIVPPSEFGVPVSFTLNITSTATPEPSSLALLGTGLLGMVGVMRRRFRQGCSAVVNSLASGFFNRLSMEGRN